jgi:hypothetical protein
VTVPVTVQLAELRALADHGLAGAVGSGIREDRLLAVVGFESGRAADREEGCRRSRSTTPVGLIARTWNVCAPEASGPMKRPLTHGANGPPSTMHSKVDPGIVEVNENTGAVVQT